MQPDGTGCDDVFRIIGMSLTRDDGEGMHLLTGDAALVIAGVVCLVATAAVLQEPYGDELPWFVPAILVSYIISCAAPWHLHLMLAIYISLWSMAVVGVGMALDDGFLYHRPLALLAPIATAVAVGLALDLTTVKFILFEVVLPAISMIAIISWWLVASDENARAATLRRQQAAAEETRRSRLDEMKNRLQEEEKIRLAAEKSRRENEAATRRAEQERERVHRLQEERARKTREMRLLERQERQKIEEIAMADAEDRAFRYRSRNGYLLKDARESLLLMGLHRAGGDMPISLKLTSVAEEIGLTRGQVLHAARRLETKKYLLLKNNSPIAWDEQLEMTASGIRYAHNLLVDEGSNSTGIPRAHRMTRVNLLIEVMNIAAGGTGIMSEYVSGDKVGRDKIGGDKFEVVGNNVTGVFGRESSSANIVTREEHVSDLVTQIAAAVAELNGHLQDDERAEVNERTGDLAKATDKESLLDAAKRLAGTLLAVGEVADPVIELIKKLMGLLSGN